MPTSNATIVVVLSLSPRTVTILVVAFVLSWGMIDAVVVVVERRGQGQTQTLDAAVRPEEPDVADFARSLGFEVQVVDPSSSVLQRIVDDADRQEIRSAVLLWSGDRSGRVTWFSSHVVKDVFRRVKVSTYEVFSGDVRDVRDETVRLRDAAPFEVFAFTDPRIGEERLMFVRLKSLLIEISVAEGQEAVIQALLVRLAAL